MCDSKSTDNHGCNGDCGFDSDYEEIKVMLKEIISRLDRISVELKLPQYRIADAISTQRL